MKAKCFERVLSKCGECVEGKLMKIILKLEAKQSGLLYSPQT